MIALRWACSLPEVRVFGQSECGDIDGRLHPILGPAIVCCRAAPCHSRFACVAGAGSSGPIFPMLCAVSRNFRGILGYRQGLTNIFTPLQHISRSTW